jgi:hypothetical protein
VNPSLNPEFGPNAEHVMRYTALREKLMKKQEAIDLGNIAGKNIFEGVSAATVITTETTRDALADLARSYITSRVDGIPSHLHASYADAFIKAFCREGMAIYYQLPEVIEDSRWKAITRWAERSADRDDISSLIVGLKGEDPAHALSWAENAFRQAGRVRVAAHIKANTADETRTRAERMKYVMDLALGEAMREARYPSSSTSTTSNLMSRYVASAWAEFYEDVKFY